MEQGLEAAALRGLTWLHLGAGAGEASGQRKPEGVGCRDRPALYSAGNGALRLPGSWSLVQLRAGSSAPLCRPLYQSLLGESLLFRYHQSQSQKELESRDLCIRPGGRHERMPL